jgi:anti-sigma regulatory factor (Ser/Thr protein kinase)
MVECWLISATPNVFACMGMDHAATDAGHDAAVLEHRAVAAGGDGGFRHWMMLYGSRDEFALAAGDFLREGIEQGEGTLVVVQRDKIDALRRELGGDAARVRFEDMENVGRNPARIIPAWQEFVGEGSGRALRGIGEPIYARRTPAELVECQLHEALINTAFAETDGFTLLCPYDTTLPAPVIEEAFRSHPAVHVHGTSSPSVTYLDGDAQSRFGTTELPAHTDPSWSVTFGSNDDLAAIRRLVSSAAAELGLDDLRTQSLVLVVHETAANSVAHGGGAGVVSCWRERDDLVVEVEDAGRFALAEQPLVGRVRPACDNERGRGLWLANQLADLVQVRTTERGTVVRVVMSRV